MCGSTGISVSRRGLPAVITSNNSFSLEDKSPFLGADMLVINSLQLDYNGTNKTQRSLLNGCFPWLWQSAAARAWRLAQIELSFGMYHCVLLKGVQAKKKKKTQLQTLYRQLEYILNWISICWWVYGGYIRIKNNHLQPTHENLHNHNGSPPLFCHWHNQFHGSLESSYRIICRIIRQVIWWILISLYSLSTLLISHWIYSDFIFV